MTAGLTSITVFVEAKTQVRAAAHAMLSLVASTLRAQFPTGAYLVLTSEPNDHDEEELRLHSVRDAQGEFLWDFPRGASGYDRLPSPAPAGIAALWGTYNPQDPIDLICVLNDIWQYDTIELLPEHARQARERDTVCPPFGIPLTPGTAAERTDTSPNPSPHTGACN